MIPELIQVSASSATATPQINAILYSKSGYERFEADKGTDTGLIFLDANYESQTSTILNYLDYLASVLNGGKKDDLHPSAIIFLQPSAGELLGLFYMALTDAAYADATLVKSITGWFNTTVMQWISDKHWVITGTNAKGNFLSKIFIIQV